jgi:sugar/nucleoside kinase (ribokinase family)
MSVTVVGSVALDTVETPWGRKEDALGGAATFFSLAASNFTQVHLVAVIGEDFPPEHLKLLESRNLDLDGLEKAPGKTFRWSGRYHDDINLRDTLDTQLNVFEHFQPKLTEAARSAENLFLANIHPALQLQVLDQAQAKFIGLDTMNLWIDSSLDDLKKVLAKVNVIVINDSEVRDLTGEKNLVRGARSIASMGPQTVVVKKGEHGCIIFQSNDVFAIPAFPLEEVVDPTGAGDSFAGGFMGYLAKTGSTSFEDMRRAIVYGSATASFACESFGPDRLTEIDMDAIQKRYEAFRSLTVFA